MLARSLLLIAMIFHVNGKIDLKHCRHSLGMQDKRIPDEHVIASSSHARGTGPNFARLGREEGDGAWCPKGVLHPGKEDHWLQVKLPSLSFVRFIDTQGRYANGLGQEYTPSYKLNYSRDGRNWFQWRSFSDERILTGNVDAETVQRQKLNPGIPSVSFLRFIPLTSNPMSVCARIEVIGCEMPAGVVQYDVDAPGDERFRTKSGGQWTFDDELYDGRRDGSTFRGGLGQLTDGVIGSDNIHETRSSVPSSRTDGFDYVGWRNNKRGDRSVTFTFAFAHVRNFTAMHAHCLSSTLAESRFPSHVQVSFSLSGQTYLSTPYASKVAFNIPDSVDIEARTITVPLGQAAARYVQATFKIRGKWLLISEIEFECGQIVDDEVDRAATEAQEREIRRVSSGRGEIPTQRSNVAAIGLSLAGVIFILVLVVIFLTCRHRKLKKTMTPPRYSFAAATSSFLSPTVPNVTLCLADQRAAFANTTSAMPEKSHAAPTYHEITRVQAASTLTEDIDPGDVMTPWQRMPEVTQLAHQSAACDRLFEQPDVTMCASAVRDGLIPVPSYAETAIGGPPSYATPLHRSLTNGAYAVPWSSPSPATAGRRRCATPPEFSESMSEASTALLVDKDRSELSFQAPAFSFCGGNSAVKFPPDGLEYVKKLGEGHFGEVKLCMAHPSIRNCTDQNEVSLEGGANEPVLVAVKSLRNNASLKGKDDFLKEAKTMARFHDPNVARVLAVVCTANEPSAVIIEYAANGNLFEYLRKFGWKHRNSICNQDESPTSDNEPECDSELPNIGHVTLMSMAIQIAAGMKYLASMGFVHRDMAARNCLVGRDHSIRIAAFEMMRDSCEREYYKMQGKVALPIRWMSWESMLLQEFTAASDVWAFGVTVWEIFTLCKRQPYHAMDDSEVIDNMQRIYERTGEEVYMTKPKACPASVFNMVRQCWSTECEDRPGFDVLYSFLKERL